MSTYCSSSSSTRVSATLLKHRCSGCAPTLPSRLSVGATEEPTRSFHCGQRGQVRPGRGGRRFKSCHSDHSSSNQECIGPKSEGSLTAASGLGSVLLSSMGREASVFLIGLVMQGLRRDRLELVAAPSAIPAAASRSSEACSAGGSGDRRGCAVRGLPDPARSHRASGDAASSCPSSGSRTPSLLPRPAAQCGRSRSCED